MEEDRVLRDDAEQTAQAVDLQIAQIDTVDRHAPLVGVVKARDQVGERRLAGAARPHEGDDLTTPDREVDVADDGHVRVVSE